MERAAAQAGAMRYLEAPARRVLNPVRAGTGAASPGRSANPYLNCEHACVYCFARDLAELRAGGPTDFDHEVWAKPEAPARLREEVERLARSEHLDRPIIIGTSTDPYQPLERTRRITRGLLEVLATVPGARVALHTKSDLVVRDLDLLQAICRRGHVRVSISLCTVDAGLARLLEPKAPSVDRRLRAVEQLSRAGVPVGVHLMPVLPGVTDAPREVRAAIWAARNAGARWLAAQVLFLRGAARDGFFAWLERERPDLVRRYRRWYRGDHAAEGVEDRVRRVVEALRRQVGLPAELPWPATTASEEQLPLFAERSFGDRAPAPRPGKPLPCLPANPAALQRPGRTGVA